MESHIFRQIDLLFDIRIDAISKNLWARDAKIQSSEDNSTLNEKKR
jgi:hypothetical protein